MKKLIIICISLLVLVGCGKVEEPVEQVVDISNTANSKAIDRTAELIGEEIKLAYTEYLFDDLNATPDSFCSYMNSKYFRIDGATIGICKNSKVTIVSDDTIFEVSYNGGVATIKYDGGTKSSISISLN